MRLVILSLLSGLTLSCSQSAPEPIVDISLDPIWRISGFENPESALFVAETGFLYVSNVAGEGGAVDGNGYISRLTLDGEIDTLRWATSGLSAPKGLAYANGQIFVTDITDIVAIDLDTGEIGMRFPAPGAGFLNDAIAGEDGRIYASDSATQRIYVLEDNGVSVWAEDDLLSAANGMWLENDRMLLITMNDRLVAIDRSSRDISVLAEGVGDGDGIAPDGYGGYLANEWPGQTYRITPTGEVTVLDDARADEAYTNDFTIVGDIVYTPHFNSGEVSASRILPVD